MDSPILKQNIFLSYYGDDFTGSTDVLETLAFNGIPAALFLNVPDKQEVENFRLKVGVGSLNGSKKIKAFGVAGVARSQTPAEMDQELPEIFQKISQIPSDFFHYKVCSTFDSSPLKGNIGHAVELALNHFSASYIPLLVGAPFLNRFVIFGNLFARVGTTTFRLDRHPTMSKHPVTPMNESDLREHLKGQTSRPVQLMDKFSLEGTYGDPLDILQGMAKNANYVLFDTIDRSHLLTIGQLLVDTQSEGTSLIVGSSGVEYALAFHLQELGIIKLSDQPKHLGEANGMVVMAGSAAPGTADQIRHMESQGHQGIRIDTKRLLDPLARGNEMELRVNEALKVLERGLVPLVYTALGPDDQLISETIGLSREKAIASSVVGRTIGETQGKILKEILTKAGKLRVVVAGGDTSGYVSRVLEIYALETLFPIAPGAPLCIAHSRHSQFDGLEIALKGGQNGNKKYFESVLNGEIIN